ncbi:MAG: winged helix-turn-helix domain-containing protein [Wenzhouxiangellaceae bacterium]
MSLRYRFQEYEVVPESSQLLRRGEALPISPKTFALIQVLLERRGETVSKGELLERVWGHRHVTDAALARVVMHARKALGDDGQAQNLIRTVHGQGVMFVAPVTKLEVSERAPNPGRNRRRPHWTAAAFVIVMGLAGLSAWILVRPPSMAIDARQRPEPSLTIRSIDYAAGDIELETLAAALPEVLTDRMAAHGVRVFVRSDSETVTETGNPDDPAAFRSPSSQAPDGIDIMLETLESGLQAHVHDVPFGPEPRRVVASAAPQLVNQLTLELLGLATGQGGRPLTASVSDPMVEELELRARIAWSRGHPESARRALDAAIALQPENRRLELLRVEISMADSESPSTLVNRFLQGIEAAGDDLNPLERAVLLQRAGVHAWHAGDAAAAVRLLEPALKIARNANALITESLIRKALSMAQQSLGEFEAAWENARIAIDMLRGSDHAYSLGMALTNLAYMAEDRGHLEHARSLHAEALALRQRYGFQRQIPASQYGLARIARRTGALTEAAELVRIAADSMARAGQDFDRISALEELAVIELLRGRFESAEQSLIDADALAARLNDELGRAWLMDVRGRLHLAMNDYQVAVDYLRRSVDRQLDSGEIHETRYSQIALLDALWRAAASGVAGADQKAKALNAELMHEVEHFSQDQRAELAVVQLRKARLLEDSRQAESACGEAISLVRDSGALDREAAAAVECALIHHERGNSAEAQRMAQLARSWSREWHQLAQLPAQH